MLVFAADPEFGALPYIVISGYGGTLLVNSHVQQMHASGVLAVVPPHVGPGPPGLNYHRDPVKLGMPWMKYVSRHCR